jgi:hypothetical protein
MRHERVARRREHWKQVIDVAGIAFGRHRDTRRRAGRGDTSLPAHDGAPSRPS